jgi:hypothetical protein
MYDIYKQEKPIIYILVKFRFWSAFLKKESEAYEITSLSVSHPLITFEPTGRFL